MFYKSLCTLCLRSNKDLLILIKQLMYGAIWGWNKLSSAHGIEFLSNSILIVIGLWMSQKDHFFVTSLVFISIQKNCSFEKYYPWSYLWVCVINLVSFCQISDKSETIASNGACGKWQRQRLDRVTSFPFASLPGTPLQQIFYQMRWTSLILCQEHHSYT